jgi:hypothetical protein
VGDAEQPVIRKKTCQKVTAVEVLRVIQVLVETGQALLASLQVAVAGVLPVVDLVAAVEVSPVADQAAAGKVNEFL